MPVRLKGRGQKRRQPGSMTATERRYSEVLEAMRLSGEIERWDFEPERLVIAKNTQYTPDFRLVLKDLSIVFVEVKPSGWKFIPNQDKSTVKIKVAAELHPYVFWRAIEKTTKEGGGFVVEVVEPRAHGEEVDG
jgi:hypothetical protein